MKNINNVSELIKNNIRLHELVLNDAVIVSNIRKAAEMCIIAIRDGGKVMICGNGESAADAQHMAAELVGRFQIERKGLPAIALTTDTSIITAWTNDYDYDTLFSRQVQALGNTKDILIGISTSGNSKNVIKAFEEANSSGIKTIGLLGKDGGKLADISNVSLTVPDKCTARIQEVHIMMIHIICELIENEIFKNEE